MRLSPTKQNRFLHKLGQRVAWRAAHDCPCKSAQSGAAAYACPSCHGLGYIWDDALTAYLALTGQKQQRMWAAFNMWQSGDVVLSLPSDEAVYDAGEFDRIVLLDSTQPFSVTRTHGANDRLYKRVSAITHIFWLDGGKRITGGIPTVSETGALTFSGGAPPDGVQYTITGREHPQYFIFTDIPRDRAHHGGARLPRLVVARLFDLFGRGL